MELSIQSRIFGEGLRRPMNPSCAFHGGEGVNKGGSNLIHLSIFNEDAESPHMVFIFMAENLIDEPS